MYPVVIKDYWTSKTVFSRLFNSDVKGSLVANKLFGEPIGCLLLVDEAHLLFAQLNVDKKHFV